MAKFGMDYSRFENLADSDEEAPATKDVTSKKLRDMHKKDPEALDQMEREVKATRRRLEEVKRLRDAAQQPGPSGDAAAASIAGNIQTKRKAMKSDIRKMRDQQADIEQQMRQLDQLQSCGDEKSLLEFFQKQGLTEEQLRRGLGGDATGLVDDLSAEHTLRHADDDKKTQQVCDVADQLSRVLRGEDAPPPAVVEEAPSPPPPPKPLPLLMVQPDCSQKRPTATDASLVVTVTLPGCRARDAKLDVSETHLRLYAPAPALNGRAREYRLNAPLARRVRSEEAHAKWNKKASALVVTIPVVGAAASSGKE